MGIAVRPIVEGSSEVVVLNHSPLISQREMFKHIKTIDHLQRVPALPWFKLRKALSAPSAVPARRGLML